MTDEKIVALYLKRDERAIEETANSYGKYLWKIAYNILSDEYESEECVSDTYVRTWNAIPPAVPRFLSAFLARITRNLSLDRVRARAAERRGGGVAVLSLDELAECVGGVEVELDSAEIAAVINKFLSRLDRADRQMFLLRYFHEEPISDIARKFKRTEGSVKVKLHRMRESLREMLEKEGLF